MDILEELSARRRADAEAAARTVPYAALLKRIAVLPAPRHVIARTMRGMIKSTLPAQL